MRFDLLDEYSTLVPFGLGISRNRIPQDPILLDQPAKRNTIANFAGPLESLRKLLGALRQMVLPIYRNLVGKHPCLD